MGTSWPKAVGDALSCYVKPKGRNMAQAEFLMLLNAKMQRYRPVDWSGDTSLAEKLRLALEPPVVEEVRRTHPGFAPERWPANV